MPVPIATRETQGPVELYVPRDARPSVRWADLRSDQGRAAAAVARSGTAPNTTPVTTGPILVVDDDPAILEVIGEFLEVMGYPVETAANGVDALQTLGRSRPSLVLLDMQMPVLDGRAFAGALRDRGYEETPILVMTASESAKRWAKEIGAAGYIPKPLDLLDLLAAVEEFRAP